MMKPIILLVEDNAPLRSAILDFLTREQFSVIEADCAAKAAELYRKHHPQFVLLDIMLPDGDGYDLIPSMRAHHDAYIIMLSSLNGIQSKKISYEKGADDYICKPFDMWELKLKIQAAAKRLSVSQGICRVGDISLRLSTGELTCGENSIFLPPTQSSLLKALIDAFHQETTLTVEAVSEGVLSTAVHSRRQLNTMITRLRKSLSECGSRALHIESVYGKGYYLVVLDGRKG